METDLRSDGRNGLWCQDTYDFSEKKPHILPVYFIPEDVSADPAELMDRCDIMDHLAGARHCQRCNVEKRKDKLPVELL